MEQKELAKHIESAGKCTGGNFIAKHVEEGDEDANYCGKNFVSVMRERIQTSPAYCVYMRRRALRDRMTIR